MTGPIKISFATDLFTGAKTKDGKEWVRGESAYRKDLAPGTAEWSRNDKNEIAGLRFICPCGCGSIGICTIKEGYGRPKWTWNGNELAPTLKPSIQKLDACATLWHGYLTDGIFKPV